MSSPEVLCISWVEDCIQPITTWRSDHLSSGCLEVLKKQWEILLWNHYPKKWLQSLPWGGHFQKLPARALTGQFYGGLDKRLPTWGGLTRRCDCSFLTCGCRSSREVTKILRRSRYFREQCSVDLVIWKTSNASWKKVHTLKAIRGCYPFGDKFIRILFLFE